jgi:hypothetical protein
MKTKRNQQIIALSCTLSVFCPVLASAQINFINGVSLPSGGEIVSYANGQLLTTNSTAGNHAIQTYSLTGSGSLTSGLSVDLASTFDGAANISSVSSVLADARGFGVATVIPTANGSGNFGRISIFNTSSGAILKTLDVGYHPDSVTITPDGSKLIITNEGEFVSTSAEGTFARPGSISVVDISSVNAGNFVASIGALTSANVGTFDFSSTNLGTSASLLGIRDNTFAANNATTTALAANIEPEYTTATNTKAYITLQENNAIATFDLSTSKYEVISSLGSITQIIDASDRDGASNTTSIGINDTVKGLPMPDTVTQFSRSGTLYLVTVNEGDARGDDADIARANTNGLVDTVNSGSGDLFYSGSVGNTGIGRLSILKDMGNLDGDAGIEDPHMMGTRSVTIWNASTSALVFDSGSMIESYVAANDSTTFNMNNGLTSNFDTRSDDKGPEPEALAFGSIAGRDYLFVGAERQNGIFQFDITDLNNVSITNYFNTVTNSTDSGGAFISPESILFLDSLSNPSGKNLLIVGFEGTGTNGSIGVFEVVPEPGSAMLGALGLTLVCLRRRKVS